MRKDELVELCQERLTGGDQTEETMGKFHDRVIEGEINLVLKAAISSRTERNLRQMVGDSIAAAARDCTLPVTKQGSRFITKLSKRPLIGSGSIKAVMSEDLCHTFGHRNGGAEVSALTFLQSGGPASFYLQGATLNWTRDPGQENVVVRMVPDFLDMDDDHELDLPGNIEKYIVDTVYMTLAPKHNIREDVVNDQKPDSQA